jgi:hypothetical protein
LIFDPASPFSPGETARPLEGKINENELCSPENLVGTVVRAKTEYLIAGQGSFRPMPGQTLETCGISERLVFNFSHGEFADAGLALPKKRSPSKTMNAKPINR